jgi:hypothetical protein
MPVTASNGVTTPSSDGRSLRCSMIGRELVTEGYSTKRRTDGLTSHDWRRVAHRLNSEGRLCGDNDSFLLAYSLVCRVTRFFRSLPHASE